MTTPMPMDFLYNPMEEGDDEVLEFKIGGNK